MRPTLSLLLLLASPALLAAEGPAGTEPAATEQAAPQVDPTWQVEDVEAALAALLEEDVRRDLQEGAPWLQLDKLPDYVARPKDLPQKLNGKANEALWKYVLVLLARGQDELALETVELLRDPSANTNPKVFYQGNLTLAELRRARAQGEKAQEAAIRGVLSELPAKRFWSSTSSLQSLFQAAQAEAGQELPSMYASALDNLRTYPMSPQAAQGYLRIQHVMKGIWQHLETWKKVYDEQAARARAEKPHPYTFRTVDMEQYADQAHPVVVGIFDSGVEVARFNMYENPGEYPDGLDNDGNGLVDDLYGLVWDWDPATRSAHSNLDLLEPMPPELAHEYETYLIGAFDRRMGLDTPEARALNEKLASLSTVEEQKDFERNMGRIGEWAHGTHVAGLATAGNRWAQVASFRFAWTGEERIYHERGPSDQELRWERESIEQLIDWINAHHVRVLNASLGFTVEYQEAQLAKERDVFHPELPAYGKRDADGNLTPELDLDRIHQRAVEIQEFRRELWKELFDGCPDTLFVLAAGNDDHDVAEYQDVPVTIQAEHDNLLIVGAVDEEGEWASFTNFNPEIVPVFDFGVNVPSYSPSGRMIRLSGTSMAAPNATNTVAKLFSLYPELTPSEVRRIVIETADPLRKPYYGGIVDEVAAVKAAAKLAAEKAKER